MIKKILSTFIIILLIFTILPSTSFAINNIKLNQNNLKTPPLPGCMNQDELDLIAMYDISDNKVYNKITPNSIDEKVLDLIQSINENIYLGYLENLTSFGPRETATQACENAGIYIHDEFQKMGIESRYQEWSNDYLYGTNIEATIPGIDENSNEIFIICAHYDSVEGSPGADDDGSGVAAVLTAAKIMSQYYFNNTVKFVTFSGEEQGIYGSYYYVEEAVNNNDNIIAVLNVDMIGFALTEEDESYIEIYEDENSEWLADYAVDISQEYYDYIELEILRSGYTWGSDHYRFWEAGYNALFYAEYNFNDYYHSPEDIIENMNIPYAVRSTKLITATLSELSGIGTTKQAPNQPKTPIGTSRGGVRNEHNYTTSTTDDEGDMLYYKWDWGDGSYSEWLGPYESGEEITTSHIWDRLGKYSIKVKAKDEDGFESLWSQSLKITMPRHSLFIKEELIRIFQNNQHIFNIFQKMLRL